MISFLRSILFWSFTILVMAIAVANRKPVTFNFDPFNSESPALVLNMPLYIALLGAALIGIVFGCWSTWRSQAHVRRNLRESQERIRRLEREVEMAQSIIAKPADPEPATKLRRWVR